MVLFHSHLLTKLTVGHCKFLSWHSGRWSKEGLVGWMNKLTGPSTVSMQKPLLSPGIVASATTAASVARLTFVRPIWTWVLNPLEDSAYLQFPQACISCIQVNYLVYQLTTASGVCHPEPIHALVAACHISSAHMHAPLSHWTSLTKKKFKD